MKIVVDSNIFFSALLSPSNTARLIFFKKALDLFTCNLLFIELFKHKNRIGALSSLSDEAILNVMYTLVNRIQFVNPGAIPPVLMRNAYDLCRDIDEKDTPFFRRETSHR